MTHLLKIKTIFLILTILLSFESLYGQDSDSLKCNISIIQEMYQNRDKISGELMLRFLKAFGKDCRNNVEFSEFSNETLYKVIQKHPVVFSKTLEDNLNKIDFDEIIFNLENPLHDLIDINLTINKIADTEIDKSIKNKLIIAINSGNWNDLEKIESLNGLTVILFHPDSTQFTNIVNSENSHGIYEASSDFGYYGNKVVELYKDSTIDVKFNDNRFFIVNNEVIDKMQTKSAYGFILINEDKFKIETGIMVDVGIQQMINDFYRKR